MSELFEKRCEEYREAVHHLLSKQFTEDVAWDTIYDSMRYSLLAGGKRIRPILTLEFCRMYGGDWQKAVPLGCALEMIHTYSLIHDDLPCMDNDDFRRGRPTNHRIYGEDMATLAGDGLQSAAFAMIAQAPELTAQQRIDAVAVLAKACGPEGMVAGQVLDMEEHKSREELLQLHTLKAGALIAGAAELGCIAANADDAARSCAKNYAYKLGLAFQVYDDLLDVIGNAKQLGKPVGSDKQQGKFTFVNLMGAKGALDYAKACTEEAKASLDSALDCTFLCELADSLIQREN